jgi:hypothetical protein
MRREGITYEDITSGPVSQNTVSQIRCGAGNPARSRNVKLRPHAKMEIARVNFFSNLTTAISLALDSIRAL